MNSNNQQDWEPVILRKKPVPGKGNTEIVSKNATNKHSTQSVSGKAANDFDPEHIVAPVTSNIDIGKAIASGRSAKMITKNGEEKPMTQTDLDHACNFPLNTIKTYENGTAVLNRENLTKIERVLGIKIPRPPKN